MVDLKSYTKATKPRILLPKVNPDNPPHLKAMDGGSVTLSAASAPYADTAFQAATPRSFSVPLSGRPSACDPTRRFCHGPMDGLLPAFRYRPSLGGCRVILGIRRRSRPMEEPRIQSASWAFPRQPSQFAYSPHRCYHRAVWMPKKPIRAIGSPII